MVDILSGGLFTVFAPTDEAFLTAFKSFGESVNTSDSGLITNILLQHIIWATAVYSEDLACDMEVQMANDEKNTITCNKDGAFFIGEPGNDPNSLPEIIGPDVDACNGVIHILNEIILPR